VLEAKKLKAKLVQRKTIFSRAHVLFVRFISILFYSTLGFASDAFLSRFVYKVYPPQMVQHLLTSHHWHSEVLRFWTSSIIRNSKYMKTQRFGICFRPQMRRGRHILCWVPCRTTATIQTPDTATSPWDVTGKYAVAQWLWLALSKRPNAVGLPPPPTFTWGRKQIQYPKRCFLLYLEFLTMDKDQKPSNSECYTPSSERFRFYITDMLIACPNNTGWKQIFTAHSFPSSRSFVSTPLFYTFRLLDANMLK
jgi:hypothetical protein